MSKSDKTYQTELENSEREPVYENVDADIVDERTGENIPRGIDKAIAVQHPVNTLQTQVNINTIGTIELSPETEKVLDEPLDERQVLIRPDGMVYLPWTWYAERLNRAFGRLKWGLMPQGGPEKRDTGNNNILVVWGFWLVIKGVPVNFSIGETSYRTNNSTMSYGDAMEGAKSIALARNCKMLGMSLELWNQAWVADWKKKYAEKYEGDNGRTLWRMKRVKSTVTETPATDEARELGGVEVETTEPEEEKTYTVSQLRNLDTVKLIASKSGKKNSDVVNLVGSLDNKQRYTISQLVSQLKEKENAES